MRKPIRSIVEPDLDIQEQPRDAPAKPPPGPKAGVREGPEARKKVKSALEALAEYFPAEVLAFYIPALAIFNAVASSENGAHRVAGNAASLLPTADWNTLFAACLVLILMVMLAHVASRNRERMKQGKTEKVGFTWWPFIAAIIALTAWVAATPGGPCILTPIEQASAAVAALFLLIARPQLEQIPDRVKRKKKPGNSKTEGTKTETT